jgi:hypothetical protein
MKIVNDRRELPWAYAKMDGFKGEAPGLYFRYFRTADEAKASRRAALRAKQYAGPVEFRPAEAWALGSISF